MKPVLIKRLQEPFSAQNEAERAAKAGFDLIAAGGDGTINRSQWGRRSGKSSADGLFSTTNDCACLKVPVILWQLPALLKKIKPFRWILSCYGSKYFINIAAAGTMTELFSVPSSVKSRLGYFANGWSQNVAARNKARKVPGLSMTMVSEGPASMFVWPTRCWFWKCRARYKHWWDFTLIIVKLLSSFACCPWWFRPSMGAKHVPREILTKSQDQEVDDWNVREKYLTIPHQSR